MLQEIYEKESKIKLDFSKLSKELRKKVGEDDIDMCQKSMQKKIDNLRTKILTKTSHVIMYICCESESIGSNCLHKGASCCSVISLTCI